METYRERRRAAVVEEITRTAARRLAEEGEAGLSLRAIARDMGLSVQSLYHYFANRDELLTALVAASLDALADALEAVRDREATAEPTARLLAVSLAYRDWARAHPSEFALVYGTPIPGYRAPEQGPTTPAARRVAAVFLDVIFGSWRPEQLAALPDEHLDPGLRAHLAGVARNLGAPHLPPAAVQRFHEAWAQLHGLVVLDLFGHLRQLAPHTDDFVSAAIADAADRLRP